MEVSLMMLGEECEQTGGWAALGAFGDLSQRREAGSCSPGSWSQLGLQATRDSWTSYLLGNRLGGRPVRKADDFLVHGGQIAKKGQRAM